jgi:hypothetical protein
MDAFYLSGAATVTVIVMGIAAAIAVLSAFGMRDQPSLKGPILMVVLAVALGAGAYYVHGAAATAQDQAVAERWHVLKAKYGMKVKATKEVTDLEAPGKWRIGNQYRSCNLVEAALTIEDPIVVCQDADGRYQPLPVPTP